MSLVTYPHTHLCGYCQQEQPCAAARSGGCLFPSYQRVTCEDCAAQRFPLVGEERGLEIIP